MRFLKEFKEKIPQRKYMSNKDLEQEAHNNWRLANEQVRSHYEEISHCACQEYDLLYEEYHKSRDKLTSEIDSIINRADFRQHKVDKKISPYRMFKKEVAAEMK